MLKKYKYGRQSFVPDSLKENVHLGGGELKLKNINQIYENIIHSVLSNDIKDQQLSELMTTMEKEYSIPLLRDQEWENQNKKVIAMYRKISKSRILD